MKKSIICKVCGNQSEYQIYSSEWGTEEEYENCPTCGYFYQFAYGGYQEGFRDYIVLSWSYDSDEKLKMAYNNAINCAIEHEKRIRNIQ